MTLVLGTVLATGLVRAGVAAAPWAVSAGAQPAHLDNHAFAHDHAQGPNGTFAEGRWLGAARRGSFGISPPNPGR